MSKDSDEIVIIVNKLNDEIGTEKREIVRNQNLWHRATFIFIFCGSKLYVQKRSLNKDYCPGYYDVTFGGVLSVNEKYDENAKRELYEESGIDIQYLQPIMIFPYSDHQTRVWGKMYKVAYDGDLVLQKSEVDSVELLTIDEIFMKAKNDKFCPDSFHALKLFLEKNKI